MAGSLPFLCRLANSGRAGCVEGHGSGLQRSGMGETVTRSIKPASIELVGSRKVLPEQVRVGMDELSTHIVVLYDGVCGLCNRFNRFLLRRDPADRFRLAPLQSQFASRVLARHRIDPHCLDTVYVVRDYDSVAESLLAKTDAVSYLLREMGGAWNIVAGLFGMVPKKWRTRLYDLVAGHRYQLFGKYEVCRIPLPEQRKKFIEE